MIADLCTRHSTDKVKYAEFYDELFLPIKDTVTKVLEIGVYHGGSCRMWHELFPQAHVDGVDNSIEVPEGIAAHIQGSDWFTFWQGNQQDRNFLAQVAQSGPWDIIIDDGSHNAHEQLVCFQSLSDHLKPGGYYIIEDLHPNDNFAWMEHGNLVFAGLKKSPMTGEGLAIFKRIA